MNKEILATKRYREIAVAKIENVLSREIQCQFQFNYYYYYY